MICMYPNFHPPHMEGHITGQLQREFCGLINVLAN